MLNSYHYVVNSNIGNGREMFTSAVYSGDGVTWWHYREVSSPADTYASRFNPTTSHPSIIAAKGSMAAGTPWFLISSVFHLVWHQILPPVPPSYSPRCHPGYRAGLCPTPFFPTSQLPPLPPHFPLFLHYPLHHHNAFPANSLPRQHHGHRPSSVGRCSNGLTAKEPFSSTIFLDKPTMLLA